MKPLHCKILLELSIYFVNKTEMLKPWKMGKLCFKVAQCLLLHALKYYSVARTERTAVRHVFLVYSFKQRFLV